MRVRHVGTVRAAKGLGAKCDTGVITQSKYKADDLVAILSVDKHATCYDLEGLANWFVERTLSGGALPFLPDTTAPVPPAVYKRILDEALRRVDGFEDELVDKLRGLSTARRTFVHTGRATSPRRTRREAAASSPRQRSPQSPRFLLSELELLAMLPDASDLELLAMLPDEELDTLMALI